MMKKILYFILFVLSCSIFTSCNKCLSCEEVSPSGDKVTEWREICGDKEELKKYQEFIEAGKNPGNQLTCKTRQ